MNQKLPISVKGIVIENQKVWLRKNERNEWEIPGGKLDEGEQPTQTVIRELQEELGFDTEVIKLIDASVYYIKNSLNETKGVLVLSYLCKLIKKTGTFEFQGEAGKAEFHTFSFSEISELHMPQFYKDAILAATQEYGTP